MINETVMLMAQWAGNEFHGVNALAALVPRSAGFEAPPVVSIFDDAEDRGTADDLDVPAVPALAFWGDSDVTTEHRQYNQAKQVAVAAAFITGEDADPLTSVRNCGYILRGARISFLSRYNSIKKSQDSRDLNGIRILSIDSVEEHRVTVAIGRRKMWGFIDIRATVVDTLT